MIHDLLFSQYARNHDVSEAELLNEAVILYFADTGEQIPPDMNPDHINACKRHFLNKQSTFTMDFESPGCVPRGKPTRSGRVIS